MNKIEVDGKPHFAPVKWAEMQPWHLVSWAKILAKDIDPTDAFALATVSFYQIVPAQYFKMEPAHHVALKATLAFLKKNELVTWLIKCVSPFPGLRFHGPSDRLSTSTIQEFRFSELYYQAFIRTGDEKFLDQLIATLYRRKGSSNKKLDHRKQLSQILINANAGLMKRLSPGVRQAILFNYEGCRLYIFQRYGQIFKESKGAESSKNLPDLESIILTVAGGKFGTDIQTEDTALYRFLDHLAQQIEDSSK